MQSSALVHVTVDSGRDLYGLEQYIDVPISFRYGIFAFIARGGFGMGFRNATMETRAQQAAQSLRHLLDIKEYELPSIGIILGTGWGDTLTLHDKRSVSLKNVRWFELIPDLEGHAREIAYGMIGKIPVLALRGRIHLNEESPIHGNPSWLVRLQIELFFRLGVRTLIVTSAVGSLDRKIKVGDVVAVNGFITVFAPPMPLYGGEFVSPEDSLDGMLRQCAFQSGNASALTMHSAGHVMLRGPFFEGRIYDKKYLRKTGAKIVGMSMLPEACVAALYDAKVLALGFVTNDAVETHSHEENISRAKQSTEKLGNLLDGVVRRIDRKPVSLCAQQRPAS